VVGWAYPGALEAGGAMRAASHGSSIRLPSAGKNEDQSAAYRARARVRRYAAANWLDGFMTLTFASRVTVESAVDQIKGFFGRSRRSQGKFPFIWTVETTRRVHAHALVPLSHAEHLGEHWSGGHSDRVNLTSLADIRTRAGYIAKDFGSSTLRPRYHVARGYAPERIRITADSATDFLAESEARFGMPAESSNIRPGSVSALWLPYKTTIEK